MENLNKKKGLIFVINKIYLRNLIAIIQKAMTFTSFTLIHFMLVMGQDIYFTTTRSI